MPGIRLSRAAETHLEDIWVYSLTEWGEVQAETYAAVIEKALTELAGNPRLGRLRPEIRAGYRSFRAGKHIIFYCVSGEIVDVLGILHERMDPGRHLED